MPWNALLLALVGGFLFYREFGRTRFLASRSDGQRLLLESALYGVILLIAGYVVCRLLVTYVSCIYNAWAASFLYYPGIGPPLIALFLGLAAPLLFNSFINEKDEKVRSYRRFSDYIGLILYQAQEQDAQIAIDLKNKKVYIGLCVKYTPPGEHDRGGSILMQPVMSGYRDPTTHDLKLSTDYSLATRDVIKRTNEESTYFDQLKKRYLEIMDGNNSASLNALENELEQAFERMETAKCEETQKLKDLQIAILSSEVLSVRIFDRSIYDNFTSNG